MKRVALAFFALALLLAPLGTRPEAWAQPSPAARERARKYFDRGQKLYSVGRFDEALVQYEKAYGEVELPELLFNIAQCHRNLEHYDLAIFTFRKYLREKPDAGNRDAVEKLIEELEAAKPKGDPQPDPKPDPKPDATSEAKTPPPRLSILRAEQPTGPDLTLSSRGTGPDDDRPEPSSPIYKRWWFWTGIAAVAGVAVAGVIFIPGRGGVPDSDLGPIEFSK